MFTSKHQSKLASLMKRKAKDDEDAGTKNVKSDSSNLPSKTIKSKDKRKSNLNMSLKTRGEKLNEESKSRLAFSLFRSINEYLYSNSSDAVMSYMDADTFNAYHDAYTILASKWPIKPIDTIITWMVKLYPNHGKGQTFADMGCGDKPMIADHFTNAKVHSFDLFSKDDLIIKSCITSVPLEANSCHCVVYSLSLMNTNVVDVIKEASRILKNSGHLIIAEVSSRFIPIKDSKSDEKDEDPDVEKDSGNCDSVGSFSRKLMKYFNLKLKRKEFLKPNDYFVIFDFVKVKETKSKDSNEEDKVANKKLIKKKEVKTFTGIPEIKLNPCLYKPR